MPLYVLERMKGEKKSPNTSNKILLLQQENEVVPTFHSSLKLEVFLHSVCLPTEETNNTGVQIVKVNSCKK